MKAQKAKKTIFGGNFLAESAYLKLPFWRGSGGKSKRWAFLKTQKENENPKGKIKAQKTKEGQNEGQKAKMKA